MGILEKLFPKSRDIKTGGYKTFTEYNPVFSKFYGNVYEQELTRAAISRVALACSKLKPEIVGSSKPEIRRIVETVPNDLMTWPKFLNRLATMYEVDGEAFVVPGFNQDMTKIVALFPLYCQYAEVLEYRGEPWVRFHFDTGDTSAIELKYVCILTKYPYRSDFAGEPNCLDNTMMLIDAQNKAQKNAIENGAKIRFIGRVSGQMREEDLEKKRDRFIADQLGPKNESGLMLYDATFSDIQQVDTKSYVIDNDEMERIENNVFNYFGVNKDILQNSYDENTWSAFYEGKIEPFAIELGEGLNKMLFTERERKMGNEVSFSSNRLEYSSNASKRNMIRDMLDRGVFTINEAREILQMRPVDGGDVRVIRGEYINADAVSSIVAGPNVQTTKKITDSDDRDLSGDDVFYKDTDSHGSDDYDDK